MSWRLSHKRLELLREVIPTAIRIGLLRHSANAGLEPQVRASKLAGQALGVELHVLQIGGTADFEPTIRSAAERGITALATVRPVRPRPYEGSSRIVLKTSLGNNLTV
jgi:ABC-type uncharacterized transport system substrate-binding protein